MHSCFPLRCQPAQPFMAIPFKHPIHINVCHLAERSLDPASLARASAKMYPMQSPLFQGTVFILMPPGVVVVLDA